MLDDGNARLRAPFLQTPEALIDSPQLTDAAVRLLQGMVKLPPRNARNSDAVARQLRMGKEKTNSARKGLRSYGHWHARKRQNAEGLIRDQRMASLVPLRTAEEVAAGWAAAEDAARLGKDTATSRRLGVRILNSVEWQRKPAAGSADVRSTRRRLPREEQREPDQTPLPSPGGSAAVRKPARLPKPCAFPGELGLEPLVGLLAGYARQGERTLQRLRTREPRLALPGDEARELGHLAGHHLLRGTRAEELLDTLTQGLPAEGVRCPARFVRHRLLRYLPPLPYVGGSPQPDDPAPPPQPPPSSPPTPDVPVNAPDGPAAQIAAGAGWRDVLARSRAATTGDD